MAPDKKRNLLEAFRTAGDGGAGPFAGPPPGARPAAERPPGLLRPRAGGRPIPAWVPLGATALIAFVLGIAVGRSTGRESGEALAAGPGEGGKAPAGALAGPSGAAAEPPAPAAPPGETARETPRQSPAADDPYAPLRDPRNLYTVLAATYGGGREDHARATQRLLADQGLPAFRPVKAQSYLEILVGAGPTRESLADVLRRVKEATDEQGTKGAFHDATIVKIDDHLRR
ncbi:MAG: hypothetical protein AB1726_09935 [Planctomycetota bacterium]